MQVQAQVVEGDIRKVRPGLKAEFTVSGEGDNEPTFRGTVADLRLVPTNDRGAVYYKVILGVANERDRATGEWLLRPGLTASVDVLRRVHEGVWKLPSAALNFQPDDALLSQAARAKLGRRLSARDRDLWHPVWVPGPGNKPWPVFVRLGGTNAQGEAGLQDSQFTEVLEWDPDLEPTPDPRVSSTFPRVIIGMNTPKKGGLFSPPNIKF
jgi:HlyD family secretion protein